MDSGNITYFTSQTGRTLVVTPLLKERPFPVDFTTELWGPSPVCPSGCKKALRGLSFGMSAYRRS